MRLASDLVNITEAPARKRGGSASSQFIRSVSVTPVAEDPVKTVVAPVTTPKGSLEPEPSVNLVASSTSLESCSSLAISDCRAPQSCPISIEKGMKQVARSVEMTTWPSVGLESVVGVASAW